MRTKVSDVQTVADKYPLAFITSDAHGYYVMSAMLDPEKFELGKGRNVERAWSNAALNLKPKKKRGRSPGYSSPRKG